LAQAQEMVSSLQESHEREMKELHGTMQNYETKCNRLVEELRKKYGNKIEMLTATIEKIQENIPQ
jgi:predicted  nucleic acid-binding Zn-ribbon protein